VLGATEGDHTTAFALEEGEEASTTVEVLKGLDEGEEEGEKPTATKKFKKKSCAFTRIL
jgi:hypothetical protein